MKHLPENIPAFVVSLFVSDHICRDFTPHLEGLGLCDAPNVRESSRIWRVIAFVSLQTWVIYLAFGGFDVVLRSKRG